MELTGKIINILPIQSGIGKNGNEWKKQEIIIQTEEQYPKNICITLWGNTISSNIKQGDKVKASVDIESREFNGKWYTTVKAWKIESLLTSNENEVNNNIGVESNVVENVELEILAGNEEEDDGLPF